MELFTPPSPQQRGLELPGAPGCEGVKERTRQLMINFPHALPLPDLSKQGRARNRKRREEKRLGKESLPSSRCLNFPAGAEAGEHGPSRHQFPHSTGPCPMPLPTSPCREARPQPCCKQPRGLISRGLTPRGSTF